MQKAGELALESRGHLPNQGAFANYTYFFMGKRPSNTYLPMDNTLCIVKCRRDERCAER
jgi:hypothetical protein